MTQQIPYDGSLPHRVGLEIRLTPAIPANNAIYTFTPATNLPVNESGREIVDNDTCNACHDNLSFHGGARFDLQYCAMCHESYSYDAQSGNTIDLKVMIHKIHSGETPAERRGRRFLRHLRLWQHVHRLQPRRVSAGQAQLHHLPRGKRRRHAASEQLARAPSTRRPAAPAMTTSISSRARITAASPRRTTRARPATARTPTSPTCGSRALT